MSSEQRSKCTVVSLEDPDVRIKAQFNPAKIKKARKVPWSRHPSRGSNAEMLEFTAAKNKTLTVELFFDSYESKTSVEDKGVAELMKLTEVEDLETQTEEHGKQTYRRPPFVMIVWGRFPPFKGVIESLDVEYTKFLADGTPARATCSLSLTEVSTLQMTAQHKSEAHGHFRTAGYKMNELKTLDSKTPWRR